MRIAVYYDLPYGGAFRSMEEIIPRLQKNHEVVIFNGNFSASKSRFLSRFFTDLESLVFQRYKQKQLAKIIDSAGFDIVFVSHDRISQAPWLLRYIKTKTVFLCQEPTRAYFEKFLDIDSNLPLFNKLYERINRHLRRNIEITNALHASKIIANSIYSVESIFRAYGIIATPVYLGVDKNVFFPKKVKKYNQVFIVGNNEPQKGLDFAIRSISKIAKKIRPVLAIGSPRFLDLELKKLAKSKGVKLKMYCGLKPEEIVGIYRQSLLTIATAYLEPFGLSVVESLACGTPVVAVQEGGFKETVSHGETGLLSPRDQTIFAEYVSVLVQDKNLRDKMSNKCLDASRRFSWESTVSQLESIFKGLYEH